MKIGYARVSSSDQLLDSQLDALRGVGCERLFSDVASGAKSSRPGLEQALGFARSGDQLVVTRLDRLGRSLQDLIQLMQRLEKAGVAFESLAEKIDTTTPAGRLLFHVFASLAEFERGLIIERTQAGLKAARARGRHGGAPRISEEKQAAIRRMSQDRTLSPGEICKALGVSRATFYRYSEAKNG